MEGVAIFVITLVATVIAFVYMGAVIVPQGVR